MAYLFCFVTSPLLSQHVFSETQTATYKRILNLSANEVPYSAQATPQDAYLLHLQLAIEFLLEEDINIHERLEELEDDFISIIEDEAAGPLKNFFLAEIKLRNSFINLKLGNELTATWQLRQAYKLITDNQKEFPGFIPSYKTLGLLHVLIGAVPDQYQWVINLLGMEGDIQLGLDELTKVSEQDSIFALEARVLRSVINAYLLNNIEKADEIMTDLLKNHPHNSLLAYVGMAVFLKSSNARAAEAIYDSHKEEQSNPLLHYQAGEMYLQLGKYTEAEKALMRFIKLFKGQNFIKDTYYKLYLGAWLQNHKQAAESYYQKAIEVGQTLSEADQHAEKMLQKHTNLNPTIMQIRLFTDGGEYDKAEYIISNTDTGTFNSPANRLEFVYRKARLSHKREQLEDAIQLYKMVIEKQVGREYFAPNSCLQLGYIYQAAGSVDEAKNWYRKALRYSHHEYKNSIDNKAKAALKGL